MSAHRLTALGALFLVLTTLPAAGGDRRICDSAGLQATEDDIINAPDFTGFGSSVAISDDVAAVGLPDRSTEEPNGPNGRVAVYSCDRNTRMWSRTATLDPASQGESESGFGSALVLDGNRLIVGSMNAVHVFELTSRSKWQLVAKLAANGTDESILPIIAYEHPYLAVVATKTVNEDVMRFVDIYAVTHGNRINRVDRLQPSEDFTALALDNRILVAGPQIYVRKKSGKWGLHQVLEADPSDDSFGTAGVAIQRHTILVGSPREGFIVGDDGVLASGAVYVFQLQKGLWEQTQRIRPDTTAYAFNGFGQTLDFEGRFAVIGTPFAIGAFQREWGPTFLYRAGGERFALDRVFSNTIATSIDVSPKQFITGTNVSVLGTPITHAVIERLPSN